MILVYLKISNTTATMKPDPEVIEYIDQFSADFRKILFQLLELVLEVVPDARVTVKWKAPSFSYQKRNICYIAGFKKHVTLAFYDGTRKYYPFIGPLFLFLN